MINLLFTQRHQHQTPIEIIGLCSDVPPNKGGKQPEKARPVLTSGSPRQNRFTKDEVLQHIGEDGWKEWLNGVEWFLETLIEEENISHFLLSRGPKQTRINVVAYGKNIPPAGVCFPVAWKPAPTTPSLADGAAPPLSPRAGRVE